MSDECLDRLVVSQLANMNLLIGAAACERVVSLPVDIECGGVVERELLRGFTAQSVPNDCCLVNARRENVIASFVPLESEDGTFVLAQCVCKSSFGCPDARIAIIRAGR